MTTEQIVNGLIGSVSIATLLEGFAEKKALFIAAGATAEEVEAVFNAFRRLKMRRLLTPEESDIDRYADFDKLKQTVEDASTRQSKSELKRTTVTKRPFKQPPLAGMDVVQNNDKAIIAVPHSWEDAKVIGAGTRWCVAMTAPEGKDHFERYANRGALHYMALLKGRSQPWTEKHPELKEGERPTTDCRCWKLGVEFGLGETTGGPGLYVMVPDVLYKVVYTTKKADVTRNSADEAISGQEFYQLTGLDFNIFGKDAYKIAKELQVPLSVFLTKVSPATWTILGENAKALRDAWATGRDPAEATQESWMEFWNQSLSELQGVPDTEDEMQALDSWMSRD